MKNVRMTRQEIEQAARVLAGQLSREQNTVQRELIAAELRIVQRQATLPR